MRRKVNSRYNGRKSPETEQRWERLTKADQNECNRTKVFVKVQNPEKNEKFIIFKK